MKVVILAGGFGTRISEGGPSPDSVRRQIKLAKEKLEELFQ